MWKWELAKEEKKAFRPTAKSIAKYSRGGDLKQDLTFEEVRVLRQQTEKALAIVDTNLAASDTFWHALKKIWAPDTYDINGNPEAPVLDKKLVVGESETEEEEEE